MSWSDVKLADVVVESNFPKIPADTYTFSLLPGATVRTNKFGTEELVVSAAIASGAQAGRRVFLQYPDPDSTTASGKKQTWSAQALKKLEIALGADAQDGEAPAQFLNRVANNGHSSFTMTMGPSNKVRENETEPRIEPKLFSVGPAA